jgi:hypothetical protein
MLFQKSNLDNRMAIDNHICDITTATYDTNTAEVNDEKKRIIIKQKHFLLCESCFWCASSIYIDSMNWICPVCNNIKIESIPIQSNEVYKFDYDQRLGVEFLELGV